MPPLPIALCRENEKTGASIVGKETQRKLVGHTCMWLPVSALFLLPPLPVDRKRQVSAGVGLLVTRRRREAVDTSFVNEKKKRSKKKREKPTRRSRIFWHSLASSLTFFFIDMDPCGLPDEVVGHVLDHATHPRDFASCMAASSLFHVATRQRAAIHRYDPRSGREVLVSRLPLRLVQGVCTHFVDRWPITRDRLVAAAGTIMGRADVDSMAWAYAVYSEQMRAGTMSHQVHETTRCVVPDIGWPASRSRAWFGIQTEPEPSSPLHVLGSIACVVASHDPVGNDDDDDVDAIALWAYGALASAGGDPVLDDPWLLNGRLPSKRFKLERVAALAARAGRVRLVESLLPCGSSADFGAAAILLAQGGHVDALSRMVDLGALDHPCDANSSRVFSATVAMAAASVAAKAGRVGVLRMLAERYDDMALMHDLAAASHVYLWEGIGMPLLVSAAHGGHMETVEWLYERSRPERHYLVKEAIRLASYGHRVHVVRWLMERSIEAGHAPTHTADAALQAVFHVLWWWWWSLLPSPPSSCTAADIVCAADAAWAALVDAQRDRPEHAQHDVNEPKERMPMSLPLAIGRAFQPHDTVLNFYGAPLARNVA